MNNNRLIEKGAGTYTFFECIPNIKSNINNLINRNSRFKWGAFYANKTYTKKGFKPLKNGNYETLYKFD